MEESKLKKLKENYSKFQKKYTLPDFREMNEYFGIEKIAEIETDFLLREVGKCVAEHFEGFLRFVEALLNPVNVPMFLFPIIKSLDVEEKNKLMKIHNKIAKLEIELIKLVDYSEEKEIDFIKNSFKLWQEIKKDFVEIIEAVEKKLNVKSDKKNNGYLG
jgi:hypothetical protein